VLSGPPSCLPLHHLSSRRLPGGRKPFRATILAAVWVLRQHPHPKSQIRRWDSSVAGRSLARSSCWCPAGSSAAILSSSYRNDEPVIMRPLFGPPPSIECQRNELSNTCSVRWRTPCNCATARAPSARRNLRTWRKNHRRRLIRVGAVHRINRHTERVPLLPAEVVWDRMYKFG
jgi:hypothetical protein